MEFFFFRISHLKAETNASRGEDAGGGGGADGGKHMMVEMLA